MSTNINSFFINKTYDPALFATVLRRFWWWIPIFVGVLFFASKMYLRYTKPLYEAEVVLQLETEDNAKNVIEIENVNTKGDVYYSTIELLKSELLFENAMKDLKMEVSLFAKGKILTEEKYLNSSFSVIPYLLLDTNFINIPVFIRFIGDQLTLQYEFQGQHVLKGKIGDKIEGPHFVVAVKVNHQKAFMNEQENSDLYFLFNSPASLTKRMLKDLMVLPIDEKARTVSIRFRNNNPQIARDVVMGLTQTFLEFNERKMKKGSANILHFIDQQLDSLSMELKKSKDSLMDYQKTERLPDPEQRMGTMQSELERFQEELYTLEEEISTLKSINTKVQNQPNRIEVYRILPELMGKSFETALAFHVESLYKLLEEKEDLLFKLTAESSEVKRIERRISDKSNQIVRSIEAVNSRLTARRMLLNQKVEELTSDFSSLPEKRMEFNRLKNIQDLNEKYYQLLTEKKVQYAISDAGFASSNRILQKPTFENNLVEPNRNMIYVSFLLLGVFLGLFMLLYKYITYNEINLLDDLERLLPEKASVLGGIPQSRNSMEFSQIVVTDSPKSVIAESMRKIRVNLSYIHPNYKTIAISSSVSGEGKTFVALNLGAIISMTGKKVILLDLDMRKPKIHLAFNVDNSIGMSSLIIKKATLEEAIIKNVENNMDIITAGPIPPNPSELLLSENFKSIIDELKEMYDVLIIDNPPVGLVSDGVQLLSEADIPIYIFKSQYSKRIFAFRIRELFELKQLKTLNVILNGLPNVKSSMYGYGYGYGYGYTEEEKPKKNLKKKFKIKAFSKNKKN